MSEVIVFTSGKGGVGKSNLCLNTALQLTALQYRSCLFDGDLGLANVNILLGIDQEYTLDDVLFNDKSIDEILVQTGYGFDIIPGSSGVEQIANLTSEQLHSLISALTSVDDYDYFLIDTASGISRSVISFCMAARQTVIVITREATSLTDAYALLKILSVKNYQGSVRVLINDCDSIPQAKSTYLRYKKVVDKHLDIAISPAGIVLHDDHFERAVVQQKPLLELYPESIGAQCIKAFVSNLVGATEPGSESEGLSEFWQRYLEEIAENAPDTKPDEATTKAEEDGAGGNVAGSSPRPIAPPPLHYDPSETSRPGEIAAAMFSAGGFADIGVSAPALLAPMLRRLNQGELSAAELRQLIIVDPGLTLQALRLSNLDEISPQGHIESLAVLTDRLNEEDLQPMLLQAALRSGADDDGLQRWVDSYRCAVLAREISQTVALGFPDEAYLGGLLLDVGRSADDQNDTAEKAENHAARGAELLQTLGLNPMICDAVRFHHHPPSQVGTAFSLVRIVYAAHMLVHGPDGADWSADDFGLIERLIDLNAEQINELVDKAKAMTAHTASWLDLDLDDESDPESRVVKNDSLHGYLLDNLLTRTIMSPLSRPTSLEGWVRNFHRSCTLLAGIRRIICLVADDQGEYLTAVGFDGCFCAEHLDNIVIPADNSTSLVSKVYTNGTPLIGNLQEESSLNLGDLQLGRLLGGQTMICLPLKVDGKSTALMVYAPEQGQAAPLDRQMSTLLTLGTRAAEDLAMLRANIS
ncbi:MAG: AAA family ATPase [Desulfofustis sp.]|nr:AAA family ATPase [Desulfofustis sp.]